MTPEFTRTVVSRQGDPSSTDSGCVSILRWLVFGVLDLFRVSIFGFRFCLDFGVWNLNFSYTRHCSSLTFII